MLGYRGLLVTAHSSYQQFVVVKRQKNCMIDKYDFVRLDIDVGKSE